MKRVKKLLIWTWLLTKRLYKKPSFIAILLLIPLIVVGYSFAARGDSGMMTIAVCCEDPSDPFANELRNELIDSSGIIRFVTDADIEQSRQMVYEGTADAAWIIHEDLFDQIMEYVSGAYTGQGFVTVVIREQTVPLMLSNEKLSSKLFVQSARLCFLNYFRQNAPEFDDMSDEQILSNFDKERFEDSLFSFSYVNEAADDAEPLNYLMLPVRGMLAILILVSGFASSMYYISDDQDGLFARMSLKYKPYAELAYQMICVGNVTCFVLASFAVSGWFAGLFKELVAAIIYVFCCAAFCRLLRLLCRNIRTLATIMSVLAIMMLVVCPVFISLPELKAAGLLFPPTYYINAAYNWTYMLYMFLYGCILSIVYQLLLPLLEK